jgi:hypothetical protein
MLKTKLNQRKTLAITSDAEVNLLEKRKAFQVLRGNFSLYLSQVSASVIGLNSPKLGVLLSGFLPIVAPLGVPT